MLIDEPLPGFHCVLSIGSICTFGMGYSREDVIALVMSLLVEDGLRGSNPNESNPDLLLWGEIEGGGGGPEPPCGDMEEGLDL